MSIKTTSMRADIFEKPAPCNPSALIRRWAAHVDVCDTCGGDGWIRANKYEGGKYIFGKEICYACNGEGKTEYVTCPDCRAVVPAKYAAEHECDY